MGWFDMQRLNESAIALERRAEGILLADHRTVSQIVRVELADTDRPGCILYINAHDKAMTAWVWQRAGHSTPRLTVEPGFAIEPRASCVPAWAVAVA